ncbi:MAG: L,D-transpeptidase family protein [Bacteroidota bacterium]
MKTIFAFTLILILSAFVLQSDFLSEQKKFERVRTSISEKGKTISDKLNEKGLKTDNLNILILAFKDDDLLEIYAKKKSDSIYKKLISYDICSRSGELGPKRKQGDMQVPEGFYHIDRFNPTSSYYLSLGLNYPNKSDKKKSKASNLGGDIFIHGSCVTIGCLPMTDEKIKEIYLYSVYAKNNGQAKIPVYVFPFQMTEDKFKSYKTKYKDQTALIDFWKNLKSGYDKFQKDKKELSFSVDSKGNYVF